MTQEIRINPLKSFEKPRPEEPRAFKAQPVQVNAAASQKQEKLGYNAEALIQGGKEYCFEELRAGHLQYKFIDKKQQQDEFLMEETAIIPSSKTIKKSNTIPFESLPPVKPFEQENPLQSSLNFVPYSDDPVENYKFRSNNVSSLSQQQQAGFAYPSNLQKRPAALIQQQQVLPPPPPVVIPFSTPMTPTEEYNPETGKKQKITIEGKKLFTDSVDQSKTFSLIQEPSSGSGGPAVISSAPKMKNEEVAPSPTIHSKQAMADILAMFNGPIAAPEDQPAAPSSSFSASAPSSSSTSLRQQLQSHTQQQSFPSLSKNSAVPFPNENCALPSANSRPMPFSSSASSLLALSSSSSSMTTTAATAAPAPMNGTPMLAAAAGAGSLTSATGQRSMPSSGKRQSRDAGERNSSSLSLSPMSSASLSSSSGRRSSALLNTSSSARKSVTRGGEAEMMTSTNKKKKKEEEDNNDREEGEEEANVSVHSEFAYGETTTGNIARQVAEQQHQQQMVKYKAARRGIEISALREAVSQELRSLAAQQSPRVELYAVLERVLFGRRDVLLATLRASDPFLFVDCSATKAPTTRSLNSVQMKHSRAEETVPDITRTEVSLVLSELFFSLSSSSSSWIHVYSAGILNDDKKKTPEDRSFFVESKIGGSKRGPALVFHVQENFKVLGKKSEGGPSYALKVHEPAFPWEYYISSQLERRIPLNSEMVRLLLLLLLLLFLLSCLLFRLFFLP